MSGFERSVMTLDCPENLGGNKVIREAIVKRIGSISSNRTKLLGRRERHGIH